MRYWILLGCTLIMVAVNPKMNIPTEVVILVLASLFGGLFLDLEEFVTRRRK